MSQFSARGARNLNAVSADEDFITLLEIWHPDRPVRIYVCDDVVPLVAFGQTWIACPFEFGLPDNVDQQVPVGSLSINNVAGQDIDDGLGNKKSISQWIDEAEGGRNLKVTVRLTLRSEPFVELEQTMDLRNLTVNDKTVTAQLYYSDNARTNHACGVYFTPETAPGIF